MKVSIVEGASKELLDNVYASVQREIAQAKLDHKAGLIDIKTLQRVFRSLDNVRASALFAYNKAQEKSE